MTASRAAFPIYADVALTDGTPTPDYILNYLLSNAAIPQDGDRRGRKLVVRCSVGFGSIQIP
jgi:hypothetical protein